MDQPSRTSRCRGTSFFKTPSADERKESLHDGFFWGTSVPHPHLSTYFENECDLRAFISLPFHVFIPVFVCSLFLFSCCVHCLLNAQKNVMKLNSTSSSIQNNRHSAFAFQIYEQPADPQTYTQQHFSYLCPNA